MACALFCTGATGENTPQYRALLIACDEFLTAENSTPVGANNLSLMQSMLDHDTRNFTVKKQYGMTASIASLEHAIRWAFQDAKDGDLSLLYLCTHGEFHTRVLYPEGVLLLSDGALEERVNGAQLQAILDEIPGTKLILLDACNSGALIGKGISPNVGAERVTPFFQGDLYNVMTSSGGSELSWYFMPGLEDAPPGSSYFTAALVSGASASTGFAADFNRDGTITLAEMFAYLRIGQAGSTVQLSPQDDTLPLMVYDREAQADPDGALTGIVFYETWLLPEEPSLTLSFTVQAETRIAYQVTPLLNGQWDWTHSVTLPDTSEYEGDDEPLGWVTPGRKQITLDLSPVLPQGWQYGMIHVMTMGDGNAASAPSLYASRVLVARKPDNGTFTLMLDVQDVWHPMRRAELPVYIGHALPCRLSLSVYAEAGELVSRPMVQQLTRPMGLTPEGTLYYWDGLSRTGEPVPPGRYRMVAEARLGDWSRHQAEVWFDIL